MKRSRVNDIIEEGDAFIRSFGYVMPPFAYWSPEELKARRPRRHHRRAARLGHHRLRAGRVRRARAVPVHRPQRRADDLTRGKGMLYAEKIMISRKDQLSPMHRHIVKAEDIINRGGGKLVLELFMSRPDGGIDEEAEVEVPTDGVVRRMPAGGLLKLEPGESVTLDARRLARLLGRGRRRADRRGLDRQRRPHRQHLRAERSGASPRSRRTRSRMHLLVSDYDRLIGR